MPSGSLTKHLVSSLNRRFLVFDENKQKFVVQSVTLCPNVVCQMNRKYMWTYIPEQWETPALQEAGSSKLALGTKESYRICLGNFPPPASAIYLPEPEPCVSTIPPESSVTSFVLLFSETSHPPQLPTSTFSDLFSILWLDCLGGAYRKWEEIPCPFQYCCPKDIRY